MPPCSARISKRRRYCCLLVSDSTDAWMAVTMRTGRFGGGGHGLTLDPRPHQARRAETVPTTYRAHPMAAAAVVYRILFIVDPGLANVGLAVYVVGVGFLYIEVANVKAEGQREPRSESGHGALQPMPAGIPVQDAPGGRRHEAVALIENRTG
ncbi:MAG: hypothetical protein WDW38_006363 [Sanguina aurantia]